MGLMSKFINQSKYILLTFLTLFISSCQGEVGSISQTAQKLERYAVKTQDLPEGWAFFTEDWSSKPGEDYYAATYGVPNRDIIGLSETISIYPNEEQIKQDYLQLEKKWFSVGKEWPGAEFIPLDSKDEYRYACLQIFSDKSIVSCRFLQKHNNIDVIILVNFDGRLMTMSQFNEILKVLDKRLNTVTLD